MKDLLAAAQQASLPLVNSVLSQIAATACWANLAYADHLKPLCSLAEQLHKHVLHLEWLITRCVCRR